MEVRDALEADAERLASLTDAPGDVMRNLVHDRTVRVAEDGDEIVAFVSFANLRPKESPRSNPRSMPRARTTSFERSLNS